MSVQRYTTFSEFDMPVEEDAHECGEWVRYDDHAAAIAAKDVEIARLRKEVYLFHNNPSDLKKFPPCGCLDCKGARYDDAREAHAAEIQRLRAALQPTEEDE